MLLRPSETAEQERLIAFIYSIQERSIVVRAPLCEYAEYHSMTVSQVMELKFHGDSCHAYAQTYQLHYSPINHFYFIMICSQSSSSSLTLLEILSPDLFNCVVVGFTFNHKPLDRMHMALHQVVPRVSCPIAQGLMVGCVQWKYRERLWHDRLLSPAMVSLPTTADASEATTAVDSELDATQRHAVQLILEHAQRLRLIVIHGEAASEACQHTSNTYTTMQFQL